MNTPALYERRLDRTLPEPAPTPANRRSVDALAVHLDPSVPTAEPAQAGEPFRPRVTWVRPSEMATVLGSRYVRRGIDVEAELSRRARRAPGVAVSAASRRISRASIARHEPTPTITDREGLEL